MWIGKKPPLISKFNQNPSSDMLFFNCHFPGMWNLTQCNFCTRFMLFAIPVKLMANFDTSSARSLFSYWQLNIFSLQLPQFSCSSYQWPHYTHTRVSEPQHGPPGIIGLRLFSWWFLRGMVSEWGSKGERKDRKCKY